MKLVLAGRRGLGWGKQGVTINEPEGFFFFFFDGDIFRLDYGDVYTAL